MPRKSGRIYQLVLSSTTLDVDRQDEAVVKIKRELIGGETIVHAEKPCNVLGVIKAEPTEEKLIHQDQQYSQISRETKKGEAKMDFKEEYMNFLYMRKAREDEHFESQVHDAAQSSTFEDSEVFQEERHNSPSCEYIKKGNKRPLGERNSQDCMEINADQVEIGGPLVIDLNARRTTKNNSGICETLNGLGTGPTNLNPERSGSLNSSGEDNVNAIGNVLKESSSSKRNKVVQSANRSLPIKCHKGKNPRRQNPLECYKISFASENTLKVRLKKHTRERPYRCAVCKKRFSQSSSLTGHMRIHSGEKPYQCPQCGRKFAHKNTLHVHLRTHSGEKPYACSVCNKSFSQRGTLSTHMKTHSGEKPHQCPQCGRKFALKNTLNIHLRTHSGERPYECSVCDKRFSQSCSLSVHMRSHTKEKPYQCPLCYKRVSRKKSLDYHFITAHTLENP